MIFPPCPQSKFCSHFPIPQKQLNIFCRAPKTQVNKLNTTKHSIRQSNFLVKSQVHSARSMKHAIKCMSKGTSRARISPHRLCTVSDRCPKLHSHKSRCRGQAEPKKDPILRAATQQRAVRLQLSLTLSCYFFKDPHCAFSSPRRKEDRNLMQIEQSINCRHRHTIRVQNWANCHHTLNTQFLMPGIHPLEKKPQYIHRNDKRIIPNKRVNEQQEEGEG